MASGVKEARTFEDSLEVARNKEWKLKRMSHLGVETLPRGQEVKQVRFVESQVLEEIHHVHAVAPVAPTVVPVVPTASVQDDGLRQEVRQVVDLMNNISINLLSNVGNAQGHGRQSNQPSGNNGQNQNGGGSNNGRGWRKKPTCYNCEELGHISPQCDKLPRMGGNMYPLPAQLPNRSNDYGIEIRGEAGPSGLTRQEKGKTKVVSRLRLEKTSSPRDPLAMPVR